MKKIYPFLLLFFAIMLMMKHDDAFSQDYSSLSNLPQQSEKSSGVYPPRESSAFPCDSKEPVRAGSIRVNREDYVNGKLVTTLTPEEFVIDVLLGQGGDKCAVNGMISNVVFTGYGWDQATETWTAAAENRSLSYFCGGTENEIEIINGDTVVMSLDMRSGILLTTGPGRCAEGPNTSGSACGSQSPYVMLNGDADMLTLGPVTDGARLEFDFVPLQHKISFEYIFASEEYSEFVYGVNDVFGFFMAEVDDYGNIIPGTTQNIALLPNSIIPITINTVNWDASCNSTPACFPGCPDNCSIDAANPQYFVPNYDTAPYQGQYMQFDGRTVVLTAEANVTPGKTYHLKLAVANVMDNAYGSGVFLRAGSLDIGSGFINLGPGGLEMNNVFEGCEGNALEIKFPPSDTEITYIDFEYSGTAVGDIVQLDNSPMPTSLEIPLLETSVTIPYKVKSPVTLNGGEVQIIATTQRGNCDQIDSVLLTVYSKITDPQIATTIACTAGGGSITVTITGGSPNAQMSIDGGNSWQLVSDPFTGVEPDEYLLMITDYISCDTLFLPVTLYGQPVLSNTTTIIPDMCSGKMAQYTATCVIEGVIFSWERDEIPGISPPTGSGTGPTIKETLTNSTSEPITVTYVYTLIIDDCHNTQEVTVVVYPELVQPDPDDATIPYNTTHTFDLAPAIGGSGAITYLWQESIDGSTWTTAPPPNDNEYYTTPVLTCSRYYRRQATSEFCNKITSAAALVTVTFPITLIPEPPNGGDVVGEGDYACGSPVIVIAIPDTCYNFVNWTEDDVVVSTNSSYLFIATAPRILTAHFIPKQYAILTEEDPDEGGETYGGGNHDCGTEVTVTAVPAYGYDFVNWTEDDDEVANTPDYTFIAAEHRLLTAHFEPKMYDIELLVNPPLPLVAGDVFGAGSYPYGENITVSAVAETCYFFVNWTEDNVEVSKNADYTFTVTKDRILVANFDRLSYDVVVLPNPTGGGTVDGGGSHLCGDTISIWAVPNDCYEFVDWAENGVSLSTDPSYDLIVTGHHVLYANFVLKTFEVEVLPNPDPDGGTVTINSADGVFDCGATAIVKAYANNGYHFINWTKDNVHQSYAAFYQFEVTESCTMVANFEQEFYKITVEANPPAGGNVLGNATYAYDDPATVNAIVNECWEFVNWTENGVWASDDADYDFTVTKSRHLVANFVRITHDIVALADPEEGGTVTGGGIYNECETATLKATANPCYDFVNWTEDGNEVGVNPVLSFAVTEPRTLTAHFEQRYYNVIVSAKPPEYGEVSGGGEDIPCGTEVTVTATAIECYEFVNWTENGKFVSDENPYTFELTKDRDLVANFKVKICNVVVSANPATGGSVSGGANGITCNTDIIVTATPAECYIFVNWTEDGEWVSDDAEYEFTVLDSHNLVANFELETLTIKLLSNPLNSGILSGDGDHLCGDAITVTAEPVNDCYTFLNWTEDDEEVATTSSYTFTVMESRTLTANFEQQTRNLALYANPPDGGTVIGSGDHPCGEEVTAKAIPESGYVFINWTEYGDEISTDDEFTFIIMSPRILVANFALEAYQIITIANPTEGGTTTGDGMYHLDDFVTVKAIPEPTYKFINWTEDDAPVSNDAEYSFTVTESRTLVANFDILLYNVIAEISDGNYGYTTGSGMYAAGDTARVEVFVDDCYRFSNWTIEDKEVSKSKIYEFEVTDDVTVTANFNVLDFDTYAPTLWNNTFMLNLRRLETEGYAVTGCQWYKNGDEEEETRTINEFSYSAGPAITDLLEPAPTWYMFRLITSNRGDLCSTHKTLTGYTSPPGTDEKLFIYPNPVISGNSFTVEGASEGCSVLVYNQYGICVRSVIATQNPVTITLDNVQPGSYLIRADGKQGKVVIIN